ncbi:LuxR C-terminal-related transcriptional regulator [Deinococcus altitudinis]|uniref:helix-turn-helix transcriptional regulator n=1 Tax=Deinococcus altitudinis TaxID=468914 RepID=UPI0038928799
MNVAPVGSADAHRAAGPSGLAGQKTAEQESLARRLAERLSQFWPELSTLSAAPFCAQSGMEDELLLHLEVGQEHLMIVRRRARAPVPTFPPLSPRELAIARLVARGLPNKSIGSLLDISPWTVATHLRRIFGKLQVASRAAMVASLTRQDLL